VGPPAFSRIGVKPGAGVSAGDSVTVAVPVLVESATLVAVTTVVKELVTVEGAVYRPVEVMVPYAGFIVHVTAPLAALVTEAVNCCVTPGKSAAVPGVTVTPTGGNSVSVSDADLVGSAALVVFTVTVWEEAMLAGAV